MNYLMKNSDGKRSVTHTAFVVGFVLVNLKLLVSGMTIKTWIFSEFSGTDYAAAMAALGAIYVMRHKAVAEATTKNEEE